MRADIEQEFQRDLQTWQILDGLELEARAVEVYNLTQNRKLYGKNEAEPLPLASLAKTMTALVALSSPGGNSDDIVRISAEALAQTGDNSLYLYEKWDREDLIRFMLIMSSNDAAFALAEENATFLQQMNEKAERLGLVNMRFHNATGLDITPEEPSATGTATEANALAAFALSVRPDIFQSTAMPEIPFESQSGLHHTAINTNIALGDMPGVVFSKTGATNLAGGNLTVIFENKNGEHIAATVLGSSMSGRFADMAKIIQALYNMEHEN